MIPTFKRGDNEYVEFEAYGVKCHYHSAALENPHEMKRVAEELEKFVEFFADPNPEVSWGEVHDDPDRDVYDFFAGCHYISCDWYQFVEEVFLDNSNTSMTFVEVCEEARSRLSEAIRNGEAK